MAEQFQADEFRVLESGTNYGTVRAKADGLIYYLDAATANEYDLTKIAGLPGTIKRIVQTGDILIVEADESLTVAVDYTVDGILEIQGMFAIVG